MMSLTEFCLRKHTLTIATEYYTFMHVCVLQFFLLGTMQTLFLRGGGIALEMSIFLA